MAGYNPFMIEFNGIQTTCDDIAREFHPLKIVLFGSYAYGQPTEDSDADLLVVMVVLYESADAGMGAKS
jgi:predicted nucleotidyltransferase